MDFGFLSFILIVGILVVAILGKWRTMHLDSIEARKRSRRVIKSFIKAGETQRLEKLRKAVSGLGPYAIKEFTKVEQEVREELKKEATNENTEKAIN